MSRPPKRYRIVLNGSTVPLAPRLWRGGEPDETDRETAERVATLFDAKRATVEIVDTRLNRSEQVSTNRPHPTIG